MPVCARTVPGQEITGVILCAPQCGHVPPTCAQGPGPPPRGDGQDLLRTEHLPDHVPPGPGALPPFPGFLARPSAVQVTSAHLEPPLCHSARTRLCFSKA